MRYIVAICHSSDEYVDSPSFVMIPLSAWLIKTVQLLHKQVVAIKERVPSTYGLDIYYYAADYGDLSRWSDYDFRVYSRKPVISEEYRTTTAGLTVTSEGFYAWAYMKYSNNKMEGATIPFDLFDEWVK